MIKVDKDVDNVPPSLDNPTTQKRRDELVKAGHYINQDKYHNRYKGTDVKQRLKILYRGKCAFCEQCIEQFHVEHFRPKSIYYWLAYSWDNLLAVCPTCNQNKGNRFEVLRSRVSLNKSNLDITRVHFLSDEYQEIEDNQLIHPEKENVEIVLNFRKDGSVVSDDPRVNHTIKICGLNRNDLKDKRKEVWDDIERKLYNRLLEHQKGDTEALAKIKGLLEDFATDADNLDKEFIAFRRYMTHHFLPKA